MDATKILSFEPQTVVFQGSEKLNEKAVVAHAQIQLSNKSEQWISFRMFNDLMTFDPAKGSIERDGTRIIQVAVKCPVNIQDLLKRGRKRQTIVIKANEHDKRPEGDIQKINMGYQAIVEVVWNNVKLSNGQRFSFNHESHDNEDDKVSLATSGPEIQQGRSDQQTVENCPQTSKYLASTNKSSPTPDDTLKEHSRGIIGHKQENYVDLHQSDIIQDVIQADVIQADVIQADASQADITQADVSQNVAKQDHQEQDPRSTISYRLHSSKLRSENRSRSRLSLQQLLLYLFIFLLGTLFGMVIDRRIQML